MDREAKISIFPSMRKYKEYLAWGGGGGENKKILVYLSPDQITGQVLLNILVNEKGQLVTSSNLNINLGYDYFTAKILDRGKIYSKYADFYKGTVTLPSLDKLMNNVTDFTIAGWWDTNNHYGLVDILNEYITLGTNTSTRKLSYIINGGDEINFASFGDAPWKHIAIVSHNGKITFFINGTSQTATAYQEYNKTGTQVWLTSSLNIDDLCLILNQAVWTDNFTPPEEPLLGDLKYKTVLYPKNTVITDPGDLLVKLY